MWPLHIRIPVVRVEACVRSAQQVLHNHIDTVKSMRSLDSDEVDRLVQSLFPNAIQTVCSVSGAVTKRALWIPLTGLVEDVQGADVHVISLVEDGVFEFCTFGRVFAHASDLFSGERNGSDVLEVVPQSFLFLRSSVLSIWPGVPWCF